MTSYVAKQLLGCLGTLLYMGSLSPMAMGFTISQQTTPTQPSAQPSIQTSAQSAQCNQRRNQVTENSARDWLGRSLSFSQAGKPEEAAQALLRALQLTQRSPNMQFRAEIIRSIADDAPTGTLQSLVDRSVELQKPNAAVSALPLMLQVTQTLPTAYSSVKTQGLTAVAKHYIRLGQPQPAIPVLAQATQAASFLQGAEFQTKALTAIAQQYANVGNRDRVIALLDQSLTYAQQVQTQNTLRRVWIFQPIAVTYAKAGQFEKALQVADLIPTSDAASTYARDETLTSIAQEYAGVNRIDEALGLIDRLSNSQVKATALARFAGVFTRAGGAQQAQDLLNRAIAVAQTEPNAGVRGYNLSGVAQQYALSSGYPTGALPVVNLITDPHTKAQTLINLAAIETDVNRLSALVDQGLEVAKQVEDLSVRTGLINQLIDAHLTAKRFAVALQITQSLADDDPFADKFTVLGRIALQAAAANEFDVALQAIDALPATWSESRNQGFRDVAVGYARAGQFDRAMQIYQRISNDGSSVYQVRALTAIADQARIRGDRNRATGLLEQALQIANRLTFSDQKSDGLAALAIQYARIGQPDRAAQLRSQAIQVATARGVTNSAYQLRQMVEQYVGAAQYDSAIQAALAIREEGERSRTLNEIASKLIEADQLDAAIRAANALSTPEEKTRFLVEVVHHYVADGNFERANTVLGRAFETARTIRNPESRTIAVRSDLVVDDPFDRASFLEAIALKYADLGQLDRAMQVAQTLQTPALRNSIMQQIACYR